MKIKITYPFLFFISLFYSCMPEKKQETTKIIGKIINPKKDEIVISGDPFNVDSDTLFITSGNKFSGTISLKKEGIHYIFIFPEFQVIYLKPGDSLAFVLNTTEFDESFSFSGSSGFENNLLIELFLANEKENEEISRKLRNYSPEQLNRKLDSFYMIKQKLIKTYKKPFRKTSKKYKKIIELYNTVAQYRIKESYLYQNPNSEVPKDFTQYRNFLKQPVSDANLPDLLYFAKTYVENRLREKGIERAQVPQEAIKIITNDIQDPDLKDNMLMIYCKNYIIGKSIDNPNDFVFQAYKNAIGKEGYIRNCEKYIQKNKLLASGREFPDIQVRDSQKNIYTLHNVLKGHKNLISYWDLHYSTNFKSNFAKLKALKQKYPDLQVIILNDNPDDFDEWILEMPQNTDFQFYQMQMSNEKMEQLLPYGLNQVFLLDSTIIKHSLINLYHPEFEKKINSFINNK